jgi:hypothetical protein
MDCLNEVDDMKSGVFRDDAAKLSYQGRHGKRDDHIQQQIIPWYTTLFTALCQAYCAAA